MISTGDKIDLNFEVDVVQDGQEKTVNFMELADRPSVISVYMKNNTSGCDRQNKSLAEHAGWFHEKGYNLIAISKDTCGSHKRYAEKLGAAYTLVSDPEYKFARENCKLHGAGRPALCYIGLYEKQHKWV